MISSPSLKFLDPRIRPVIDPFAFCFHLDNSGTPGGGPVVLLAGLAPPPKSGMVGLGREDAGTAF